MAGRLLSPTVTTAELGESVSFGRRITDLAREHPAAIAIIFAPLQGDDAPLTWRELDERSSQVARLLAARGAGPGTMIAVALPNSLDHFFATIGAWKAGAGVIPMRWDIPEWERNRLLETAGVVLVVGEHTDSAVPVVTRADLAASVALEASPLPDVVAMPAQGIASSGSTGRPKVIINPVPGEGIPSAIVPMASQFNELSAERPELIPAPLYHTNGFRIAHMQLFVDQLIVVMEKFDAARAVDLIERWRIACFSAVPTMLQRIVRLPDIKDRDLSSIEYVMQGGAPVPEWVVEAWLDLIGDDRFFMSYGSSEAVGLALIRGDAWRTHRGSSGRGYRAEIRILDRDGRQLPPSEIGEIYMRHTEAVGPTFEYRGAETPLPTADGFTSIGDLGWLDDEGYLYVADRRTDMIVSGGANIFPAEVEAALSEHPKVRDVVVIGLPDPEWGRRVHAIIEPTDAADPPTPEELNEWARGRLTGYKVPKLYELIERMPRTDAGKLNRTALAAERAESAS
jgi:bile acid-coenzyme A ligase